MKTLYTICIALLIMINTYAFAQPKYMTVEKSIPMEDRSVNAWVINVGNENTDVLKKAFAAYCKDQFKIKLKKKGKDMMEAKEVLLPSISGKQGDLKAKFYGEGEETIMALAFMPGYDIMLNTKENGAEMENLRKFTKNFVKGFKMKKLSEELAENESRKKDLETSFQKNEREQKKIQKNLSKLEKQLGSEKADEAKKFELKNEKISNESRMEALDTIMKNEQKELEKVERSIQSTRMAISQLETQFSDPALTDGQAKETSDHR